MNPSRRALASLVACLTLVVVAAPFGAGAAAAECRGVRENGRWRTIAAPKWSSGPQRVASHAVDPAELDRLYASNGEVVAVSSDGGCRWKETFGGDPSDLPPATGTEIVSLVATGRDRVVATMATRTGGASRPRVAVSEDGGDTWQTGDVGLPPAGEPDFVRSLIGRPLIVLLGIDVGGGALDLLYLSQDGGHTWELISDLSRTTPNSQIRGVEIDQDDPDTMWAWGGAGLLKSTDGGASFQEVPQFSGEVTGPASVYHAAGEPPHLLVFLPVKKEFAVSRDGGETWFRNASPGGVDSVARGLVAEDVVISASGAAYRYHDPTYRFHDLEAPTPGIRAISAHLGFETHYFGHTDQTLERYKQETPPPGGPGKGGWEPKDYDLGTSNYKEGKTTFGPRGKRVALRAGEERTVRYRLDLPKKNLPLDVFFMMDTTDSMESILRATTDSMARIVRRLNRRDLDVQFGLGEHRAYPHGFPPRRRCGPSDPETPYPTCTHNFVYRRVLEMGVSGEELGQALGELRPLAGGPYDAHLGALYQAATGEGQQLFANFPEHDVRKGQQMLPRDESQGLNVIIHPTDEGFGTPESGGDGEGGPGANLGPPPDIPDFGEVISSLKDQRIHYVGIAIGEVKATRVDQRKIASGTGTFAPKGGVDCTKDGRVDILEGEPLVCPVSRRQAGDADTVAEAIIKLLESLPNRTSVELGITAGRPVVRKVTPEVHDGVSLDLANTLDFEVTYRCGKAQAGKSFDVRLVPDAADRDLQQQVITRVVCKEPRDEEDIIIPPTAVIPLVTLGIPPPPPPPPATQLSQAPQMQAQAQGQAQGAGAHQEEEQPQMAFVTAYEEMSAEELAFSSYSRRGRTPAGPALGAGLVAVGLMGSAATVLARRRRVQRAS